MPDILKQVIVDFETLKETALKNAKQQIIDKHSKEVKDAVEKILKEALDQEDNEQDPLSQIGMEGGDTPSGLDSPLGQEISPTSEPPVENAFSDQIPLAATEGEKLCSCPDKQETVEINFDQLVDQVGNQEKEMGLDSLGAEDAFKFGPENDTNPEDEIEQNPQAGMIKESSNFMYDDVLREIFGEDEDEEIDSIDNPEFGQEEGTEGGFGMNIDQDGFFMDDEDMDEFGLDDYFTTEPPQDLAGIEKYKERFKDRLGPLDHEEMGDDDDWLTELLNEEMEEEEETEGTDINAPISRDEEEKDLSTKTSIDFEPVSNGYTAKNSAERDFALSLAQAKKEIEEEDLYKSKYDTLYEQYNKLISEKKEKDKVITTLLNEIKSFTDKLEKQNLFNSRLLYVNKTLSDASLNERQKVKIVEAINKVKTPEEAKLIYETLQSHVVVGSLNESIQPTAKSLSEAINRKGIMTQMLREHKKPVESVETVNERERWQILSGIKKIR
jgi:hypothetical protein